MLLLEANIPEFLLSSPYLQSLLSNGPFPEEGLEIPDGSGKQDLTVNSKEDLIELLQTIRFWLVPEVAEWSSDLLMFVLLPFDHQTGDFIEVATEFRNDIPLVDELLQIVTSCEENRLKMAAGFGRLSVFRFLHLLGAEIDFHSLQAAARAGYFECVNYVMDHSPAAHNRHDIKELACREAAEHGHLSCVKQMLTEWGAVYSVATVTGAALGNHVEILKLATPMGHEKRCVVHAMHACALKGYLQCLVHLHSLGYDKDPRLMIYSVEAGHVNCLKFLHEHNYPADGDVCSTAAGRSHLECLKYAHEQGMPWDERTCSAAAVHGRLECLKYAREHGCPWWDGPAVADLPVNSRNRECEVRCKVAVDAAHDGGLIAASACRAPTIDCLLYVLEQGAALSPACASNSAGSGSLDTLQFLHARGFTWEAEDCAAAVWYRLLECLRFLHEIGTPWDERALTYAAQNGDMRFLEYLHEQGAPWGENASLVLKLESMKFVHEHGCPWHADTCLAAAKIGNLECLQYAHEHGAPWTSEVCRLARSLECYKYAVAHGCPGAELNDRYYCLIKKRKLGSV